MNFRLIFSIAKSLLLARWRQTLVAAVGVTFSIAMFVTLLGFMNGLNDMLDSLILNRTPHVRLYNEIKPSENQPVNEVDQYKNSYNFISSVKAGITRQEIYNSGPILQTVKADERVLGATPKLLAQVFYNEGTIDITGVINGIDVEEESRLFNFQEYVTSGDAIDAKNVANSIILGKGLAEILVADIGDVVQVTTAQGERFPLKVVGYFQSGIQEIDKVQSYASIATTQKLLGKPANYMTDIQVKLHDLEQAPVVAREYAQLFKVDAEDIQTANAQFETGSNVRSLISYAVGVTLLIVAGFGIFNILNMMIYEKMDSIAILKATGFSGRDVNLVFLVIAMSIGFFGGMMGLLFGFIFSAIIDSIPFNTSALPTIETYPVNYDLIYYFIGGSFSLITTYFAGFFPARKASKVDPVEIIRGK
ncbi:ABC transporter permease [Pontibacter lucknowensis]|uniref:Lipoprotein-releasing system permease protein n=1 Tax=Pontibacter lucknowensis TaxID=1077936 RepID=A0A1N6VYK6_9BACT|nr:FtsX-like permease family protein [Pontibacter lucknowensis]SIQ82967.1 lipoprotein-releasing system permease protein [Pontibacter lucknowensis]